MVVALGIDVGSRVTKAVVIRADPGSRNGVVELAKRTAPTPSDAVALVRVVFALVADVVAVTGEVPRAVGIASIAEMGAPLGPGGHPLLPLQRWNAEENGEDLRALVDAFGAEWIFAKTGVPALPTSPLATWRRLSRQHPEVWRSMTKWAGAADIVARALVGHVATDHTLAARTMAFRSASRAARGAWIPELLAAVDLTETRLSPVLAPGEPVGGVSRIASRRGGLPMRTPVHVAGLDHVVAAWGSGVRSAGDAAESAGDAEVALRVLGAPVDREAVRRAGMSLTRTVDNRPLLLAEVTADSVLRTSPGGRVDHLDGAAVAGSSVRSLFDEQERLAGPSSPPIHLVPGRSMADSGWLDAEAELAPAVLSVTTAREPVAASAALLAAFCSGLLGQTAPVLPAILVEPGSPAQVAGSARRVVEIAAHERADR